MVIKFRSKRDKDKHDLDLACYGSAVYKVDKKGFARTIDFCRFAKNNFQGWGETSWKNLENFILPRKTRKVCK